MLELKNTMNELTTLANGFNSRADMAEYIISNWKTGQQIISTFKQTQKEIENREKNTDKSGKVYLLSPLGRIIRWYLRFLLHYIWRE